MTKSILILNNNTHPKARESNPFMEYRPTETYRNSLFRKIVFGTEQRGIKVSL